MIVRLRNILEDPIEAFKILGPKGAWWLLLRLVFSFVNAGTEYGITILIVVFLFSLELASTSQLPAWLPEPVIHITPSTAWISLAVIGFIRALSQLISKQSGHAALELIRARLKMVQGFSMLVVAKQRAAALSEINLMMTEFIPKASDYIYHAAELVSMIIQSLALVVGMLLLSWQEALTGITLLGLSGVFIVRLNRLLSNISVKIPDQRARLERSIVRISRNWLLIRILHIQEREYKNYLDSVLQYFRLSTGAFYLGNVSSVLPPFLGIIILAVLIQFNFLVFHTPAINLVAFIYLFFRFTQSTVMAADHVGNLVRYRIHFKEISRQFSSLSPEEIDEATKLDKELTLRADDSFTGVMSGVWRSELHKSSLAPTPPPEIRVDAITYRWPGAQREIFRDFSLMIQAGSQFGIVGPNGSGKSTLLGIILGILPPSIGRVLIGGMNADEFVRCSRNIGYVSEDPYLILGTIRENLIYGAERKIEDAETYEILQSVGMRDDILEMPRGLDTALRENGEGLSSGQKQRLALARAFLREPTFLILDEASANLDKAVEAEIAGILNGLKGHCTTLIVSHKPEIIKYADDVLDLGAYRLGPETRHLKS
jgi:ATP-binding cassette subfamily B protein AbcA/BmrA